jgi:hypothetical protein
MENTVHHLTVLRFHTLSLVATNDRTGVFRSESVFKKSKFISGYMGYTFILCEQSYCELKSRVVTAKAAFSNKRALCTSKVDLELRKKLVKCYIWIVAFYGAETRMLRAADRNT